MADTYASITAHETFTFRVDPYNVSWGYNLRTKIDQTYGGKVVQILGTDLTTLTIESVAGVGGREYIRKVEKFFREMSKWQIRTGKTAVFSYPYKGYKLEVWANTFKFEDSVRNVAFPFLLTFNIQSDIGGQLKRVAMTETLKKLNEGVGYDSESRYVKPTLDLSTIPEPVDTSSTGYSSTGTATGAQVNAADLTAHQQANAQAIVNVAYSQPLSDNDKYLAAIIAVMVAMTESTLNNNDAHDYHSDGSDTTSRGLFQQKDAWGPLDDRQDPTKAAMMFFNGGADGQRGLMDVDGWQTMDPWVAGQSVQGSQFDDGSNFKKNYEWAKRVVVRGKSTAVTASGMSITIPDHPDVAAAVRGKSIVAPTAALAAGISSGMNYLGTPYVWGGGTNGGGPDNGASRGGTTSNAGGSLIGFDCSGLTAYILKQAGVTVGTNSSSQRNDPGQTLVDYLDGKPGDLVGYPGHIAMYLGLIDGVPYLLEAPTVGMNVSIRKVYDTNAGSPKDSKLHRWWA